MSTSLTVIDAEVEAEANKLIAQAKSGGLFNRDMTLPQALQIARLALGYGLDPFNEELVLYQGKPYLTLRGALRIANSNPEFDGMECVPASEDERRNYRCGDTEHLWKATVWRKDHRVPAVGWGRASGHGDRNPVSSAYGQEMAAKRAKMRALRDSFSLPAEDYGDWSEARPVQPYMPAEPEPVTIIEETGEIIAPSPAPNPKREKLLSRYRQVLQEAIDGGVYLPSEALIVPLDSTDAEVTAAGKMIAAAVKEWSRPTSDDEREGYAALMVEAMGRGYDLDQYELPSDAPSGRVRLAIRDLTKILTEAEPAAAE